MRAILLKRAVHGSRITGERLAQGKDNARNVIESNPEMFAEIEAKIREQGVTEDMIEDAFAEDDDEELDIRTLGLEDDE